ncbi:helix-turn-helix domain-containing protein [Salisaeta longa]|uniref:helix-turn-helix domain-containing protein n=1 Tax=Salisaeta longa TaxID=503170 RepID=UPI0003B68D0B|nr:helix-turn-helix transcriptional regulator [Salisaeta longa]
MPVRGDNLRFILGLKLRALRQDCGASLREISERSGLSISYLSEIEKGKKYPKPDKLLDLARAFDVPYDDLVSLHVDESMGPLKEVFSSTFMQEFPFDVFGLQPHDLFALVADQPSQAGALIRTFLEVARTYDMQVEHFLFAALRSYQQMHGNYFPELEQMAAKLRQRYQWARGTRLTASDLRAVLTTHHNYTIDTEQLADDPALRDLRSVLKGEEEAPQLFINRRLMDNQRAFIYARELAYCAMDVDERATTSSWIEVTSYEQVLNNFRASYVAGALLIDREPLLEDLDGFFDAPTWDPAPLHACMDRFGATPEMFFYRLTELVPHHFGLDDFFFLRFHHGAGAAGFRLTKVLNLSQVPVPHGIGLQESYCRRWPAMRLLKRLSGAQYSDEAPSAPDAAYIRAQRSHFMDEDSTFLVFSAARPLALQPHTNSCVSIGFLRDDAFQSTVAFADDPAIPSVDVNLTCERCPLPEAACHERVAPPTAHHRAQTLKQKKKALRHLGTSDD